MKIYKKYLFILIPFLALLAICIQGCLLSGTYVIYFTEIDEIISTHDEWNWASVNLSENATWKDHEENIKYIDEVGFSFKAENRSLTDSATGQLYISDEDNLITIPLIKEKATLIVDGIFLGPGETKHILWNESFKYILNFDIIKKHVESGEFHLYGICRDTPFNVRFYDIVAVITVTAGI
jgi:hypothetical protein